MIRAFTSPIILSARPATALVVAASACFGLVPLFARLLLESGLSAEAIAIYRFGFSALVVLPFLGRVLRRRAQAGLVFAAGLVMGLGWASWVHALAVVPIASAGIVYMSYPVFTIVLARLLVGQAVTARAVAAAGLVLAAALALSPTALASGGVGDLLLCLPAPIAFAFIIVVLSSMARDLGVMERLGCSMLGAITGLLPMVPWRDAAAVVPATGEAWVLILLMGLITAALPQIVYTFATPLVGPSRSAAVGAVELPTMMAIGWLAFGETVGWAEALAAALVIAAIAVAPALGGSRQSAAAAAARPLPAVSRSRSRRRRLRLARGWVVPRRVVAVSRRPRT